MKNKAVRVLGIAAIVCTFIAASFVTSAKAFSNDGDSSPSGDMHNIGNNHKDQVWCHKFDDGHKCSEDKKDRCDGDWKEGKCDDEKTHCTPTPTVDPCQTEGAATNPACVTPTATPTPQSNGYGLPGDGRSDGQSDGRSDGHSSCPSCTAAPSSNGQVLGATTDFAGTGVADDILMNVVGAFGGLSTAAGLIIAAKKRN